jgi:hypothetical protein
MCVRLVAGAGGKPAPPPHAAGARGFFFGSLPRLLLAVHELSLEGRTLGLADDEAAPHRVRRTVCARSGGQTPGPPAATYLLCQAEHVDLAFTAPTAGVHGCLRGDGTGVLLRFIVALSFAEARPLSGRRDGVCATHRGIRYGEACVRLALGRLVFECGPVSEQNNAIVYCVLFDT